METPERPERSLPSPRPRAAPPAPYSPAPAWEEVPDPEAPARRGLTPRTVLRALRRHWWQVLLLWGVLSVGAVTLVAMKVKPAYEATAWLKVEPHDRTPLSQGPARNDLVLFMETQLRLVTAPDVLGRVIADPKIAGTALVSQARDPETELRNRLRVLIPPGTSLILISMSSPRPYEAEAIVNAVAEAYLDTSETWLDSDTHKQILQLREYKDRYLADMQRLRGEIEQLSKKGAQPDPQNAPQEKLTTYRNYRQRLDQIELEIMDAEATRDALSKVRERAGTQDPAAAAGPARPSAAQLEELVKQAYLNDPRVANLHAQIDAAKQQLQAASRISAGHDPAVEKFRRDVAGLKRQNERLWAQMYPEIKRQMAAAPPAEPLDPLTAQIEAARIRLEKLTAEKTGIEKELSQIKVEQQVEGNDAIRAQFADTDLAYYSQMYQKVSLALEDAEYQEHGPAKVTLIQKARPTLEPSGGKRLSMMAAAPAGAFALVLALATLLEVRGARVADPDELSSRLRLGVIGVVPPLPSLAPPKGPKALRDQRRRLEEFVQSLDHLRVTLCAPSAAAGEPARRCVMITSAVGGEGKTTLAAQLAGRCANAGLTTLLVDADLRRPSLGELLEVPEGPGLAEILSGEAQPEEAMVVIGNAGGFHLLPAGSGGQDPSRLLQGERLGQLIARLREAFDVVLIDAPPVLPVPDALLVGRWTDGAVVAVRHDSSRFPLVERAQKRLTSIGVPLLGAVVNGVRPAESNYGAYDYYATATDRAAGA